MKKVLVTGAKGFIGKNLVLALKANNYEVLEYDLNNTKDDLEKYLKEADFLFHLAGVNRPKDVSEFTTGNKVFTEDLLEIIKDNHLTLPLVFTSSIHAAKDNDYGRSKKEAEDVIYKYHKDTGNIVYVLRLSNMFGKWSRPNYNSVIATWCYNIAHDLPIKVNDENTVLPLTYIDDLVKVFLTLVSSDTEVKDINIKTYHKTLGELRDLIYAFKNSRNTLDLDYLQDDFTHKLYATYLTYLDDNAFSYPLTSHIDDRGSFTELLHFGSMGQVSVNVIKPGITKGNHYHHTKNEKFIVVKGEVEIKFRNVFKKDITTYKVSDKELVVVDIIPGMTHNITNVGQDDAVVIMWANEVYNPANPDTYFLKVEED